jgi:pyrroline-5-carboxylate reductase
MRLGFIGTGKIASSVITGVCNSKISFNKILVSPRNRSIAQKLKRKFRKVSIAKNNQEIVNSCNWVFLAVTPQVGKKIIPSLKFRSNQKVISFIATINLAQLKRTLGKKIKIVRALPLPPISLRKGPVPICPPNVKVKNFFNHLGIAVEISNERLFTNFWCMTAMMAPYYEILNTLSKWLSSKGLKKIDTQKYITSLFFAMSEDAVVNSKKDLKILIKNSQTPGGLNEKALNELRKLGFYKLLNKTPNSVLKRLKKV